jgi:hypothetical protein
LWPPRTPKPKRVQITARIDPDRKRANTAEHRARCASGNAAGGAEYKVEKFGPVIAGAASWLSGGGDHRPSGPAGGRFDVSHGAFELADIGSRNHPSVGVTDPDREGPGLAAEPAEEDRPVRVPCFHRQFGNGSGRYRSADH